VSGHLGCQSRDFANRSGTLGDRVRAVIDASPVVGGARRA
jgi:hypothetical protein